jgi:hypothetical protein
MLASKRYAFALSLSLYFMGGSVLIIGGLARYRVSGAALIALQFAGVEGSQSVTLGLC